MVYKGHLKADKEKKVAVKMFYGTHLPEFAEREMLYAKLLESKLTRRTSHTTFA